MIKWTKNGRKNKIMSHKYRQVVYLGISKNVKTKFDTSNYYLDRPLPKGKNIKVIGSIKLN